MPPTPDATCTACGEPVPPDAEACPGCGAMMGAPSSGFSLDQDPEPAPKKAPPPPPPPAAAPPPSAAPPPPVEDKPPAAPPPPIEKTVAEKIEEKTAEAPKGETVRMSLADATQAWVEDSPTTTMVIDEDIDDLTPASKNRTMLFVVLGIAVAALIALVLIL